MKKRKLTSITVFPLILCAVLLLSAGCGSAQASEKGEQGAQGETETVEQTAEDPAEETKTAPEAVSGDPVTAGEGSEGGEYAEIPPLEETVTDEYTQKCVFIFRESLTDETADLRFYKEDPDVAYMGIREYFDLMLGGGLTVQDNGDGTYTLTNAAGAAAQVDTEKDIVAIEDLPAFENYYEEAQKGSAGSFKDSDAPYLRLREVVYEGDPEPVEFDFGGLGIEICGDGEEVWFPVSILTTWLTDIAQNRVVFNGNYLYICRARQAYEADNGYYNTPYMDSILTGTERAKDLADYSYGDLGFIFRYMYGYPGRTQLDPEILRNEGFDAALTAFGETGAELKEELSSRDFRDFWFGMYRLSDGPLEDGHNNTALSIGIVDAGEERYKAFREYTWSRFDDYEITEFTRKMSEVTEGIYSARSEDYSREGYYKYGDTAIILLNEFSVSGENWKEYYRNGGELPDDTMGKAAKGLMRAAEDAEIRNVVFDLGTNPGGYSDAVAGVISLMTGRDYLCGFNELSKQSFRVYFDVDRNLDGEIDEKDDEVSYDFNYAVITSGASFSCGNMFPFLVKEEGGMVIGDRSGGGSCSIQKAVLSEGFEISISGCKFKLTDGSGSDLEKGVTPDVQLEIGKRTETNEITGEEIIFSDYAAFGDLDGICEAVSGWFADRQ